MPFDLPTAPTRASAILVTVLAVGHADALPFTPTDVLAGYTVLALGVTMTAYTRPKVTWERLDASAGWGLTRDAEGRHLWLGRWPLLVLRGRP